VIYCKPLSYRKLQEIIKCNLL